MFSRRSRMSPEHWGRRLIIPLIQATHKQWLFRNLHGALQKLEGLTEEHHLLIFRKVEELMLMDLADQLPQHCVLLEGDFMELGEGPTVHRQYWVASLESS